MVFAEHGREHDAQDMSLPITASFRWSRNEFLRAQRLAVRHSPQGRWLYRFTTAIGVLILLSGIVSVYKGTVGWLGFLFTVLFSGIFFCMPFLARRTALRLYAQKPDRDMEVTWEISEDGIHSKTRLASSENTWTFFHRVIRTKEGFLLYSSGSMVNWLPTHAFRNADDMERFARLAKSKVRDYADVS